MNLPSVLQAVQTSQVDWDQLLHVETKPCEASFSFYTPHLRKHALTSAPTLMN